MQGKVYLFLDSDVPKLFNEMLKAGIIKLLEMKCPEEAERTTNQNYCKYHRLLNHPIAKCFILKDIMELACKGRILLEEDKVSTNQISIRHGSLSSTILKQYDSFPQFVMIKFGQFDPIRIHVESLTNSFLKNKMEGILNNVWRIFIPCL